MQPTLAILLGLAASAWAADGTPPAKDATPPPSANEQPAVQAFLGIAMDEVDDALAYHLKLDNDLGILVSKVVPGSTAEKMGIKTFDVIVSCDGQAIYTPRALSQRIRNHKIGDTTTIEVRRGSDTVKLSHALEGPPPGMERFQGRPDMMDPRERMQDMMHRHPHDEDAPGPRKGRIEKPDGSVMEWSIDEEPAK